MNQNKCLLILEDDIKNKGDKAFLEFQDDIDDFTLLDYLLKSACGSLGSLPLDAIFNDDTSKNYTVDVDIYKREILSVRDICEAVSFSFSKILLKKGSTEEYAKIKNIKLSSLYKIDNYIDTTNWILKIKDHGLSQKDYIYLKIPIEISYNNIFKNILNIIKVYDNTYKLNEVIYIDYITIEQISQVLKALFKYETISPVNMLRDDNEYNNRIKEIDLSLIKNRGTGKIQGKMLDPSECERRNIYYNRLDNETVFRENDDLLESIKFQDESIVKAEIKKVIDVTKNKFDKYNVIANGRLVVIYMDEGKDLYIRSEEDVKRTDNLYLLASSYESEHDICCYMYYIIKIYNEITSKRINGKELQLFLNVLFGFKIIDKNDFISRKVIAWGCYLGYLDITSTILIGWLLKCSDNYKDSEKVNKRNKQEDKETILRIMNSKK